MPQGERFLATKGGARTDNKARVLKNLTARSPARLPTQRATTQNSFGSKALARDDTEAGSHLGLHCRRECGKIPDMSVSVTASR